MIFFLDTSERVIMTAKCRIVFCTGKRGRKRVCVSVCEEERERNRRGGSSSLLFASCANGEIGFLITRAMHVHQIHLHASSPHAMREKSGLFSVTNVPPNRCIDG